MRLYPPAWGIAREALADCEIGGYRRPQGNSDLPDRNGWSTATAAGSTIPKPSGPSDGTTTSIKRLPRCAYFPFGDGPRICIGNHFAMMEAVLILATIARRYRLSVEPGQTLELLPSITLRPRHVLGMRLQTQDHKAAPTAEAGYQPASHARGF